MKAKAQLNGTVEIGRISAVKPNRWNPNKMTDAMKASLVHGFIHDGWLVSQALLIWGTDENGKKQNIIIDGEHRWTVAKDLDMPNGPMMFLDGITEVEAKALTIKMNQKRGEFDDDLLTDVLKDIEAEFGSDNRALDLGFDDAYIMALMAGAADETTPNTNTAEDTDETGMRSAGTRVRMVQLFFDVDQKSEFTAAIKKLANVYKTTNVTETVLYAVLKLVEGDVKK